MNFTSTLEQIEKSEAFSKFKKKNEKAFLCAGFFVIDYESGGEQQQLDYCIGENEIYTFVLESAISIKKAETIEGQKTNMPPIEKNMDVDLDDAEKILGEKVKEEKIDKKIAKIIAVLQVYENHQIWNLNCVLEGLEILRCHIDCKTGEVLKFERKNMMDFVKRVK
ncbi:hypothetical protein A3K73_04980 [Candidatus Pacearchaeota archaeon RBG_13_36_9]|nr:MAG: hypothetical protein A3K73_04980 [Candidatus Pacearchaeota archaeon RBG_13_36_9]